MLKPHRIVVRKVSLYADEAAAFIRRRRHSRREYVRVDHRDGTGFDLPVDAGRATEVVAAARKLLDSP